MASTLRKTSSATCLLLAGRAVAESSTSGRHRATSTLRWVSDSGTAEAWSDARAVESLASASAGSLNVTRVSPKHSTSLCRRR